MASLTHTFPESPSQLQYRYLTIPNLDQVSSVSVNTGTVSYSVNGDDITFTLNNGTYSRREFDSSEMKLQKWTIAMLLSDVISMSGAQLDAKYGTTNGGQSYFYDDGEFSGTLDHIGSDPSGDYMLMRYEGYVEKSTYIYYYQYKVTVYYTIKELEPVPNVPTLSAPAYSPGKRVSITISFSSNTDYLEVDKSWESGTVNAIISPAGTSHTYSTTVPEYNVQYWIRVRAVNSSGSSSWSSYRYFTVPFFEWEWTTLVSNDAIISVNAEEWNEFCERINEFRRYKGLGDYSFTHVTQGNISAVILNQAISALSSMSPPISPPPLAIQGKLYVFTDYLNQLKDSLNSII